MSNKLIWLFKNYQSFRSVHEFRQFYTRSFLLLSKRVDESQFNFQDLFIRSAKLSCSSKRIQSDKSSKIQAFRKKYGSLETDISNTRTIKNHSENRRHDRASH